MRFIIIPGIDGSDGEHWQSRWQAGWGDSAVRIDPASWTEPDLDDWCRALDDAAAGADRMVLVAHSLGCLAAAHWAALRHPADAALFMVAAPDIAGPAFPAAAAPTFMGPTAPASGLPGLLVSSDDDPYCTPDAAQALAIGWRLDHVRAGTGGHLNSASGLGDWEFGRGALAACAARLEPVSPPGAR